MSIRHDRSRPSLPRVAAAATLGATLLLAACDPAPVSRTSPLPGSTPVPGATTVPTGAAVTDREPNVISGRVATETGIPVAGARLRVVGYTGGSGLGQHIETITSGADGTYRYEVPQGLYEVLAEGPLEFGGETFLFSLDPVDGSCEMQPSDDGIVKDFVLRLTGLMMCYDGVDPDNYYFYHGVPIQLQASLTAAPTDVVQYRFEPIGSFADGSAGVPFAVERTVAAHSTSAGPLDETWVLHDIPLADYLLSAVLIDASGSERPLLVSTDATPAPTEYAELSFMPRFIVGELSIGYQGPSIWVSDGG